MLIFMVLRIIFRGAYFFIHRYAFEYPIYNLRYIM